MALPSQTLRPSVGGGLPREQALLIDRAVGRPAAVQLQVRAADQPLDAVPNFRRIGAVLSDRCKNHLMHVARQAPLHLVDAVHFGQRAGSFVVKRKTLLAGRAMPVSQRDRTPNGSYARFWAS